MDRLRFAALHCKQGDSIARDGRDSRAIGRNGAGIRPQTVAFRSNRASLPTIRIRKIDARGVTGDASLP